MSEDLNKRAKKEIMKDITETIEEVSSSKRARTN